MRNTLLKFWTVILTVLIISMCFTGCSAEKDTAAKTENQSISSSAEKKEYKYTAVAQAVATYGDYDNLEGVEYIESESKQPSKNAGNYKKTISIKISGKEYVFDFAKVENEYLFRQMEVARYKCKNPDSWMVIDSNGTVLRIIRFPFVDQSTANETKDGSRLTEQELIAKAVEYAKNFTEEDLSQYTPEVIKNYGSQGESLVRFNVKRNGKYFITAYAVELDNEDKLLDYQKNKWCLFIDPDEFPDYSVEEVKDIAEAKLNEVCEKNRFDPSKVIFKEVVDTYTFVDVVPAVEYRYEISVEDPETKELCSKKFSIYVKIEEK